MPTEAYYNICFRGHNFCITDLANKKSYFPILNIIDIHIGYELYM